MTRVREGHELQVPSAALDYAHQPKSAYLADSRRLTAEAAYLRLKRSRKLYTKIPTTALARAEIATCAPAPLHRLAQQAARDAEEDGLVRDEEDVRDEEARAVILYVDLHAQRRSRKADDGIGNAVHADGMGGAGERVLKKPMMAPVRHPLMGLRRATAKKITTIMGRSRMGKKRRRTGRNAWMATAASGTKMMTGHANS